MVLPSAPDTPYIRLARSNPGYGDKRAEIGGSDPGAIPGGSTSLRLLRELRLGKPEHFCFGAASEGCRVEARRAKAGRVVIEQKAQADFLVGKST
ncbi:MAG: hypothetical protein FD124_336 [Alphaproteobacteria bacterium]|nr:MAG: hypothetical protein FD160_227 [Caulobacteraceae bacterium]TPW08594.1 MAG: hypothetical protein FD124_336 [Alphaproteobacteria bacterium]